MSKKVYFTQHATDADFVSAIFRLLDKYWSILGNQVMRSDSGQLCQIMAVALAQPFIERAVSLLKQYENNPAQQLRALAMELLAHASFAEALSCWSTTGPLDVMFREDHSSLLDSQIDSLSLTGDREQFFALMHVCLGDLCSQSDRQATLGGGRQIAIPNVKPGQALSLFDILAPIHDRVRLAVNAEPDQATRLHLSAVKLLEGGETVLKLATMIKHG